MGQTTTEASLDEKDRAHKRPCLKYKKTEDQMTFERHLDLHRFDLYTFFKPVQEILPQ